MPVYKLTVLLRVIALTLAFAMAPNPVQAHDGADAPLASAHAPWVGTPIEVITGAVDELIVDNRVTSLTVRNVALRSDDGPS